MTNSGRDVSNLPKVTELVSDTVRTGTLQGYAFSHWEGPANPGLKVSPPDFLVGAFSARLCGLCLIHKTVKSTVLLKRGKYTVTSRYCWGHKELSKLCLDTKSTKHNAEQCFIAGVIFFILFFYLVSSRRSWLINQASQVQKNVCFRLSGAEWRASRNVAKRERHLSESLATSPQEANSSICSRAWVQTVYPVLKDGDRRTLTSLHLSVSVVNEATPCHRVNRPACSVQRHVVIAGGWKAQIHFNDCAALNSQRLRILNLMAITDLLLKALSNRFIGLKELLLWDLSHLIYLSHLRYLEIF